MNWILAVYIIANGFIMVASEDDAVFENAQSLFERERIHRYKRGGVEKRACVEKIKLNGLSLIKEGIKKLDPSIIIQDRFYDAIKELYEKLNTKESGMKKVIADNLGQYSMDAKKDISIFKKDFKKSLIYTYTVEHEKTSTYKELNQVLREHNCTYKSLSAREKLLAPYAAALMAVLMHWNKIDYAKSMTYRGTTIPETDIGVYEKGKEIVWLNFGSSSTIESGSFQGNVMFYINNNHSASSMWKPKLICNCSKFKGECEALYPPGSVFIVDKKTRAATGERRVIHLTLQGTTVGRKRRSVPTNAYELFCNSGCSTELFISDRFSVFTLVFLIAVFVKHTL